MTEGENTSFRILLFTDEFRWRINSFDAIEKEGARPHFTDEMKKVLNSAHEDHLHRRELGRNSRGISFTAGRVAEEKRARRRAEKIAVWVREALEKPVPVRKLNVGHHTPTGADETSDQRRVVVVLVLDARRRRGHRSVVAIGDGRRERAITIFEALLTKDSLGERPRLHVGALTPCSTK